MSKRVCPWWIGYILASPVRRLFENPHEIVRPYVREGMTVLEPGPGMGFFTLELARLVGPNGIVIAVDVQQKMLGGLQRRARKARLLNRIDARLVSSDSLRLDDVSGSVDFTLAYAVVHEMPSPALFFGQVAKASRSGATVLVVEPAGHVSDAEFEEEVRAAVNAGFVVSDRHKSSKRHTLLMKKG